MEKSDVVVNSADKIHTSQALSDLRKAVRQNPRRDQNKEKSPRNNAQQQLIVDELKPPSTRQAIRRAGTTKIDLVRSSNDKKQSNNQLMSPHGQSVVNCKKSYYGGSSYA